MIPTMVSNILFLCALVRLGDLLDFGAGSDTEVIANPTQLMPVLMGCPLRLHELGQVFLPQFVVVTILVEN